MSGTYCLLITEGGSGQNTERTYMGEKYLHTVKHRGMVKLEH
jgi:hypothetical protein